MIKSIKTLSNNCVMVWSTNNDNNYELSIFSYDTLIFFTKNNCMYCTDEYNYSATTSKHLKKALQETNIDSSKKALETYHEAYKKDFPFGI